MESRVRFINDWQTHCWSVAKLSVRHGVSRKTAYKWIGRFEEGGLEALEDQSRRPHLVALRTPPAIEDRILAMAQRYPVWGPRKLLAVLRREDARTPWPSKTTIGAILTRHGVLPAPKKRPLKGDRPRAPAVVAKEPNDLWSADFKGWCLSGDGRRCEPLGMLDAVSRFATCTDLVTSTSFEATWEAMREAFERYGLPRYMLADRGSPFATTGLASLSELSVTLLRLGVRMVLTQPGQPTQNAIEERFNLTMAREAMSVQQATWEDQRRVLHEFRERYNHERPHEALGDRTPAEFYTPSPRPFPREIPTFEYPQSMVVRKVDAGGCFYAAGDRLFLSRVLARQEIALQQIGPMHFIVRFGPVELGIYDEANREVIQYDQLVYADEEE